MKKIVIILIIMFSFPLIVFADELSGVENSKIFKTITIYDDDKNPIDSMSFEVTEDQYLTEERFPQEYLFLNRSRANTSTHETTYKRLTLKVQPSGVSINTKTVTITNEWLKIPAVKSNDILGMVIKSGSTQAILNSSFKAKQEYNGNSSYSYDGNSTNRVKSSKGTAIVMNIVDETSTSLKNTLTFSMSGDNTNLVINASYQHATEDISNSDAMNVSLGTSASSGYQLLGNTFIYKNAIANKYDKMQGVSVAYNPTDFF